MRELARAEAGPHVPTVLPGPQRPMVSRPSPARRQSDLVPSRPHGVDPLRIAEQLQVVVTGTTDGSPTKNRFLCSVHHVSSLHVQRQDRGETGNVEDVRDVSAASSMGLYRVDVLVAGPDRRVGKRVGAGDAVEGGRVGLLASDPSSNDDAIRRARRKPTSPKLAAAQLLSVTSRTTGGVAS